MKRLSRIIMVNWYLFEAEEWDVEGHVALVGKNGSGKSSFIDAIQLVMLGGSRADWTPNAKASDKNHKRDIRSYVLGLVKDEEAIANSEFYQPRQDALSRIVLVFKDDETGEIISVGGALSAQRSEPQADIEGFFIAHGLDLHVADLLDEKDCVRGYTDLKALLKHRSSEGDLHLFAHEPKRLMEQLMFSLGPKGRPTVQTKVRRAFKQSINMSGLEGSVSDFVKTSILDPEPLNRDQVRQSRETYKNKEAAVAKIRAQIDALAEISTLYQRAKKAGERRAGYAWCAEELRFNDINDQIDELHTDMQGLWDRYRKLKAVRNLSSSELRVLKDRHSDIRVALQSDDSIAQQDKLKVTRGNLQLRVNDAQRQLGRIQHQVRRASDVVKFRPLVGKDAIDQLDNLVRLSQGDEGTWPIRPVAVDDAIKDVRTLLPELKNRVDEQRANIGVESKQLRDQYEEDIQRLDRIKQGGGDLRRNTLVLIHVLKEAGIQAVPVCELVEVTDPMWQPAIEAYLRTNAEALIVPPHQAEKAVEIYRAAKKQNLFGATVINTERVQHWRDDPVSGTAAALIEGSDAAAVAYLRRLLKGISLVDDTRKFMQEDRALTQDGMFIRQAGVQRLELPKVPQLGKAARELQIQLIQKRIDEQRDRMVVLNEHYSEYKALYGAVEGLGSKLEDVPNLELLVTEVTGQRRQMETINQQIAAIDTSHMEALQQQFIDVGKQIEVLDRQFTKYVGDIGAVRATFKSKNAERNKLANVLPEIGESRRKIEAKDEDYNAQSAHDLYEALETDLAQGSEAVIKKVLRRIEAADEDQRSNESRASEKLGSYLTNYPSDGFWHETETKAGRRTEVDKLLSQLKEIGLHEREKDVKDAHYKVLKVVRSDLAIRLRGHINNMKRRISELNRELTERPFSANQTYEFAYKRRDEYGEYLRCIERMDEEEVANIDGLFDVQDPVMNEWVEKILSDNEGDILCDYRNYFQYDIAINDKDSGIKEYLSRKKGSASGGENKTPFYVAMGASLASAYRLDRLPDGSIHGGVSLYLADEAFEKMDRANTHQAAEYLKSIGLQLFVAAPDDAEPRLREVVDTVMFFIREGALATIELDYVRPKARELLADVSGGHAKRTAVAG